MKDKFMTKDWNPRDSFGENVVNEKSFRYAMPEYFKSTCMGCHGGEMDKKIHSGKSAAGSGTFGGMLSLKISK